MTLPDCEMGYSFTLEETLEVSRHTAKERLANLSYPSYTKIEVLGHTKFKMCF
jgi:hypothetical protein